MLTVVEKKFFNLYISHNGDKKKKTLSQYMNELTDGILKIRDSSLAGVADWIECCPVNQRVTS